MSLKRITEILQSTTVITTGVGFCIGLAEALLYYNLGQASGDKFSYKIPPKKEFLKTAATVLLTSILTGWVSSFIEEKLTERDKRIAMNKTVKEEKG